jgi:hypothetical protein
MSSLKRIPAVGAAALLGFAALAIGAPPPSVRIIAPAEATTASKLGDLSAFRTIVEYVGDLPHAAVGSH